MKRTRTASIASSVDTIDFQPSERGYGTLSRQSSASVVDTFLSEDEDTVEPPAESSSKMSYEELLTFINFCIANFSTGVFYALLAPFFPQEAAAKGVSLEIVGLIFGVFELTIVISTPFFGNYIGEIGAKFMYCAGILVCSCTSILFGTLEYCPPGNVFIIMCFAVRIVEGLGAGAFVTASFTIICNTFPSRVSSVIGTLEFFTGTGLMVGPVVGSALYQVGGFKLPFYVLGGFIMCIGILSTFLLPTQYSSGMRKGSIWSLALIPGVLLGGWLFIGGSACIGFLDVALSLHLQTTFNLSQLLIGVFFLIEPCMYGIFTLMFGALVDRKNSLCAPVIALGYTSGALGLLFLGPSPILGLPSNLLWLNVVSLVCIGIGFATLVASFRLSADSMKEMGYDQSIESFGMLTGFANSCFSLGAFAGPLAGGTLVNSIGFAWTSSLYSLILAIDVVILLIYIIMKKPWKNSSVQMQKVLPEECTSLLT